MRIHQLNAINVFLVYVCMQQLPRCRLSLTFELLMNGLIEGNILYSAQRLFADMSASYHAADSNIGVLSSCMYVSMFICMYQCICLSMYVSR